MPRPNSGTRPQPAFQTPGPAHTFLGATLTNFPALPRPPLPAATSPSGDEAWSAPHASRVVNHAAPGPGRDMQALAWLLAVILLPQILGLLARAQGAGERGVAGAGVGWQDGVGAVLR